MRIAILSHNTIRNDARIIKEIQTLEKDFPDITAFGLKQRGDPSGEPNYPFRTPVILTKRHLSQREAEAILDGSPRFLSHHRLKRVGGALAAIGIVTAGASILGHISALVPLALLLAAAFGIETSRRMRRRLKNKTAQSHDRQTQDAGSLALSPKNGEIVNIEKRRLALFKLSYHLVDAVCAEALSGAPFQVIHAHDLPGLDAGVRIKKKKGGILIWDAHEIYEDLANPDPAISAHARHLIKDSAPYVDHFITINDGIAEFYKRHHPALPAPVILMNATVRAPLPQDDGRLRNALEACKEQKILLFQGGFSMHRGLTKLVCAARDLPNGWILAMMGDGHLRDELIELAEGINAETGEARVQFLPTVPQAELIYWTAGATLGAIPYENVAANHWYCTPNKLWEYPAAGVPFIAPRLHEISRIVDEYGTGFLFPADFDAVTISDLIATIDDEALAAKRANIARFVKECSWEVFAPRLIALYREIAEETSESSIITFETPKATDAPIATVGRKAS